MARTPRRNSVRRTNAQPAPIQTGLPAHSGFLFEAAWEVCAQVGGIYTVLRSKAPYMNAGWGDSYCLLGPYWEESAKIELEPHLPVGPIKAAMDDLAVAGIKAHYGRWLITGRPQAVLFDLDSARYRLAQFKYLFWKDNGISSPPDDGEYDNVVLLGYLIADFLQSFQRRIGQRPVLLHCHEWQGGAALPVLRHRQTPVASVFTTHATLVGRSLSAANADLYESLLRINAGAVAHEHGFAHRHAVEGAAAQCCDVFTTVSSITALEAIQFLGRKPDVLVPNGLNIERFAAPHEFQNLHQSFKERIHEFVLGHFFPSYTLDLDKTIYVFTSGRYEYRNKGIDVFIEALHQLNQRMRAEQSPMTVVAFIITRAPVRGINNETLNRQAMFNELRDACEEIEERMGRRLFQTVATARMPTTEDLLQEYESVKLKRLMYALRRIMPPPIVTHDLWDDAHDSTLQHLRHRGLWNGSDDRVKVVFHPQFMTATSPLLGMDYDQFVHGCHLGVFPSYYEPWGYTPMECIVRGIPAITSDLSGFGDYVLQHFDDTERSGMYVARRRYAAFNHTVDQVANWIHDLAHMTRRARIDLRNRAEGRAEHFDWNNLGRHYTAAHAMALERHFGTRNLIPVAAATAAELDTPAPKRRPKRARR
jgi:glycogen synthase